MLKLKHGDLSAEWTTRPVLPDGERPAGLAHGRVLCCNAVTAHYSSMHAAVKMLATRIDLLIQLLQRSQASAGGEPLPLSVTRPA